MQEEEVVRCRAEWVCQVLARRWPVSFSYHHHCDPYFFLIFPYHFILICSSLHPDFLISNNTNTISASFTHPFFLISSKFSFLFLFTSSSFPHNFIHISLSLHPHILLILSPFHPHFTIIPSSYPHPILPNLFF